MTDRAVHESHCDQGEYGESCKYDDADCPMMEKYIRGSEKVGEGEEGGGFICKCKRVKQLEKIVEDLSGFFRSGNGVPVERATIYGKQFWEIVRQYDTSK